MMDSSDLKILRMLLTDARMPLSQIARELGISQPAAQKRIEKLKANGIITGSSITLNNSKIGWKRALVAMNVRKAGYDATLAALTKLPMVSGVYQTTGPYGIVVELLGPAGVVNGLITHMKEMKGVAECCPISLVEKVL